MVEAAPPSPLPAPLPGHGIVLHDPRAGRLQLYGAGPSVSSSPPVLLVHSVNAAASAYEVRPVYERLAVTRPTYAIDLPGFGLSDRSPRRYVPRLMTDAIHAAVEHVRHLHPGTPIDALAVSLSCEFLARAAGESASSFRTLALVSPTGLTGRRMAGPSETTLGRDGVQAALARRWLGPRLFGWLTRPGVVRYFLQRTYGRKAIDEGLWAYAVATAHQPGAEHAPLYFLSGHLFSRDATLLYDDVNGFEFEEFVKKIKPDLVGSGIKEKYIFQKMGIPLRQMHSWDYSGPYHGYDGFAIFARDMDIALSNPTFKNLTPPWKKAAEEDVKKAA